MGDLPPHRLFDDLPGAQAVNGGAPLLGGYFLKDAGRLPMPPQEHQGFRPFERGQGEVERQPMLCVVAHQPAQQALRILQAVLVPADQGTQQEKAALGPEIGKGGIEGENRRFSKGTPRGGSLF